MARIRNHRSRDIEDHIVEEGHGVEVNPEEKINWDTKSAEVHADPLIDTGTGKKIIARRFYFQLPPGEINKATEQEMLDWHKKNTVIPILWKDELELVQEPRIVAGKKGKFTIVALCEARIKGGVRSYIGERPELIQDIIQNTHGNSTFTPSDTYSTK